MSNIRGVVLYRGKSLINNENIVVIASITNSKNEKIGDMIQTWILLDNNLSPYDNSRNGKDEAICGDCIHRGKNGKQGSCYVNLLWAPNQIYKSYLRGNYPDYSPRVHNKLIRGRILRYGAYGDPAAVPYEIWAKLNKLCPNHTGYTHAWRNCDQRLKKILMASVDTPNQVAEANKLGWRTFRVRIPQNDPLLENEITCPASKEAGKIRTCATCKACHGAGNGKAKNIAIIAHGWKHKLSKFKENRAGLIALEMAA